jgi:hypothetical protein
VLLLTRDEQGLTYHIVTQAVSGRGAAPNKEDALVPGDESGRKKERVLHTRVPAVLERQLKRFADDLRVPVSNLVRTILEDALHVANFAGSGIEQRLKTAAQVLEHEREHLKQRVKSDPLAGVLAFQAITLAQPTACGKCGDPVARGTEAHLAVSGTSYRGKNLIVCRACLPSEIELNIGG